MQGHNYALPDCIKYIFERIGDYEYLDFWNIAAVTGDAVAQVYNHNPSTRCEYCVSEIIGYENDGNVVKLLVSDKETIDYEINNNNKLDLIFIGDKQKNVSIEDIYISAIKKMPYWLTLSEQNGMYFGEEAFYKWADDIEMGRFAVEGIK